MDKYLWAERHDGLITKKVATKSGETDKQWRGQREAKRLRQLRRGVAVVNGAPPTWRQAVRAVLLACGDRAVAALWTALRLLGGPCPSVDEIHVLGDLRHQVVLDGVVSHRSGSLEESDIVIRDGMRCTSPLRTVIDLSGPMSVIELGEVVDDFLRRKLLKLEDLRERVARLRPAPGRSVATLRKVLARRLPGYDPGESALEARIIRVIDRSSIPKPTQQYRVRVGNRRYRLDFAWPDRRIYLEGNGFGYHSLTTDLDRDARRQNDLVADGWTPIEITWRMTDQEIADNIRTMLRLRT